MINLAVVFGSKTCEHDVSIVSGLQAVAAAEKGNYHVVPLYIARDGNWYIGEKLKDVHFYEHFDPQQVTRVQPVAEKGKLQLTEYQSAEKMMVFKKAHHVLESIDVVMPVMHGMNGEDGTLQGLLELWNVPYTSAGVLGCAVGMDKIAMKMLFRGCGFPVLEDTWIDRGDWALDRDGVIARCEEKLPYPMFVKPANLGSSIGISRANDREGLIRAIDIAVNYDRRILIERGVRDLQEVNCSALGYGDEVLVSETEMPLRWDDAELLDFNKKYLSGGKGTKGMQSLQRRIPAPIKPEQLKQVLQLTEDVFRALDMKGVCRIDYLIDQTDDKVYLGEINSIPGSLAFYLWEPKGLSFTQLVDKMVEYALRAHTDKNQNTFTFDSSILQNIGRGAKGAKA